MTGLNTATAGLSGQFALSANGTAPKSKRRRLPPFSLRLTASERARLEREAGETPLATYIKLRLFNNLPPLSTYSGSAHLSGGHPASDVQLIAKLLAALGESRMASNLNQLAKAANMGTLETGPDMERELLEACAAVQAMRKDLITALGLRPDRRK